jgi:hypothetical protein
VEVTDEMERALSDEKLSIEDDQNEDFTYW